MRLLGLVLDQGLTFWPLVLDLVARAKKKVWALIRLRDKGATMEQLSVTYQVRVRNILEYACPVWTGLINGLQIKKLEDVQRLALSIILGREAKSYSTNLTTLDLPTLEDRRLLLTKEFAVSLYTSKRHLGYLVTNPRFGDRSRVDQHTGSLSLVRQTSGETLRP